MTTIGDISMGEPYLFDPQETLAAVARRMSERGVGALVAVDPAGAPIGIITDRDIVVGGVAKGIDATRAKAGEIMTAAPKHVRERTPIETAVALMRQTGVRRLPVVDDDGRLTGIVSVDDVIDLIGAEISELRRLFDRSRSDTPGS